MTGGSPAQSPSAAASAAAAASRYSPPRNPGVATSGKWTSRTDQHQPDRHQSPTEVPGMQAASLQRAHPQQWLPDTSPPRNQPGEGVVRRWLPRPRPGTVAFHLRGLHVDVMDGLRPGYRSSTGATTLYGVAASLVGSGAWVNVAAGSIARSLGLRQRQRRRLLEQQLSGCGDATHDSAVATGIPSLGSGNKKVCGRERQLQRLGRSLRQFN